MSNAGVSLIMQQSAVSQEAVKALSVPVPGAVVVAPLTQSWRNYGSSGGEFTRVDSPVITSNGAVFDGANDAAILTCGASSEFTLFWRLVASSVASPAWLISTMQPSSSFGGYGFFRYDGRSNAYWCIGAPAGTEITTSAPLQGLGAYCLKLTGGVLSLHRDGTLVASASCPAVNPGTRLFLGARGSAANAFAACTIRNVTQYQSSLTAGNQSLVEAWL